MKAEAEEEWNVAVEERAKLDLEVNVLEERLTADTEQAETLKGELTDIEASITAKV